MAILGEQNPLHLNTTIQENKDMLLQEFCTQLKTILGITENKTIAQMTNEIPAIDSLPVTASLIERTVKSYSIPYNVTRIGYYAFMNCSTLSAITIPDSVTEIGNAAFYACTSLTSITIPNSVTKISVYAFAACTIHFRFRCSESEVPTGYPWGAKSATSEYNYTGE